MECSCARYVSTGSVGAKEKYDATKAVNSLDNDNVTMSDRCKVVIKLQKDIYYCNKYNYQSSHVIILISRATEKVN